MKASFFLLAVVLPACLCFYREPMRQFPNRVSGRSAPSLEDFLQNVPSFGASSLGKRCVNTFDEGCVNGGVNNAGSDDDWLNNGNGNNPGRR